jgi:hypothetical protein
VPPALCSLLLLLLLLLLLQFTMPSPDVLHVHSTVNVNGKTCSYRQVYNRKQ